ncbi:MAG: DUF3846 domain-containing protein [Oscillospiraceae bacterium]|nr:DUF3846 domain-containing protein [Oscillospiraceae bacterium]
MTALKIDPDGTMKPVEITGETISDQNDSIHNYLGGYFDTVRLSDDAMMLVNDEGLLMVLPVNVMAMMISGYPMLVGVALIVGLEDTPDGGVFVSCPDRFLRFADTIAKLQE